MTKLPSELALKVLTALQESVAVTKTDNAGSYKLHLKDYVFDVTIAIEHYALFFTKTEMELTSPYTVLINKDKCYCFPLVAITTTISVDSKLPNIIISLFKKIVRYEYSHTTINLINSNFDIAITWLTEVIFTELSKNNKWPSYYTPRMVNENILLNSYMQFKQITNLNKNQLQQYAMNNGLTLLVSSLWLK